MPLSSSFGNMRLASGAAILFSILFIASSVYLLLLSKRQFEADYRLQEFGAVPDPDVIHKEFCNLLGFSSVK